MTRLARRFVPLALLLVALVAAWWWGGGNAAPRLEPNGGVAAADGTHAVRGGEHVASGANGAAAGSSAAAIEAARAADAVDPLAPPEPQEIDAIESEGRALFWGVVVAPDAKPCAGATILHDGKEVATSDERGHYRVEVEQRTWDANNSTSGGFEHWLIARKAGVGVDQTWCSGASRRLDLILSGGCGVSGRVRRRGSDVPVPGARVEFRHPIESPWGVTRVLMSLETTSDADGRFAFDALMGGRIALRATADEWASCGWFEFDIDRAKGRHGIDFELEPVLIARGWFVPWPPPGLDRTAEAKAEVAAIDAQVASPTTTPEPARAPVAADGTFAVRFAATTTLELRLELADGIAWRGDFDLPWEPRDLDLGRIELASPARVRGELALPPEMLELGFEFVVLVDAADGPRILRTPIGRDGRFLSPPLPAASLCWGVVLGEELAVPMTMTQFGGRARRYSGIFEELAQGEARDLGRVAPTGALLAGRVLDPRGGSTADTTALIVCGEGDETMRVEATADAQGRWLFVVPDSGARSWLSYVAGRSHWRVIAGRHGARAVVPLPRPLVAGVVDRIDLGLGDGASASGRVVDETGVPLRRLRIALHPAELLDGWLPCWAWCDGDGRFVISGLAPGRYRVTEESAYDETLSVLGELVVPCADVTLTRRKDDPADGE